MGCTFDTGINKDYYDNSQQNRRGRIGTIDTRKLSSRVSDKITENITIINLPLTNIQTSFAINLLNKLSLFNGLSQDQLTVIASLLIPAVAKQGQYIFHQQDTGSCFFLIEKGQLEVQIDGEYRRTLTQGQSFGQLAIILKTKRSASIKVKSQSKLLLMKPLIFKQTMQKLKSTQYYQKRQSLQHVQIFQGLTNKQKLNLTNALKIMVYQKGQRIINKNELANAFYIINQGKVIVEILNKENVILGKHQCFGQSAFKIKGRRKGTVYAMERTVCSMISKDDFQRNSGTKASSIYFYSMKKWALRSSQVFKNYSKFTLNKINLAFQTVEAKSKLKIRSDGLVICLQGNINGSKQGENVFGQKQWQQKSQDFQQLIQQEEGYYAYLNFKKLKNIFESIQQRKQSKIILSNVVGSNKQNSGFIDLASFDYLKDLGEGQFGTVKLIRDKALGRLYALKQISKLSIKKQGLQKYVQQQRLILQKIEFPYIVGFVKAFWDAQNVYFLMQYIKGIQMFSVIRQMPALNKPIARYFFGSLLLSIQHLHQNNIIYRDIKPQNSVVNDKGKVYLIDLGTAKVLKKQRSYKTFTVIGTPHYMSPEIFTTQGYSFQTDIWSLGVLMYQFLCNKLPFAETQDDTYRVMEIIKKDKVKYPKGLDPQAEQLLKLMLNKNPHQRSVDASFQKIKKAPFFDGFSWDDMLKEKVFPPYIPKAFKKQGGIKTILMQGKPLVKQLYPKAYDRGQQIRFKQWNQAFSY